MNAPARIVGPAAEATPQITVQSWHERFPSSDDERFDENGNEYFFVEARTADDAPLMNATGWMTRERAGRIARSWNCHDDLLAALRAVLSVADRSTAEFDLARAALAKAEGVS